MDIFSKTALKLPMPKYNYVTTDEQAKQAITEIEKYPIYSLDTETTGLDPYLCKLTLLQIGVGNKSFVFDMRNDTEHSSIDLKTIDIILQTNQLKILQNAVFDSKVLKIKRNLYLNNMYDTMLAEQLLHLGLNVKSNLATLVYKYLGLVMDKEPRSTFQNYDQKYESFQLEYAARDVTPLEMIRDLQLIKLKKEGLEEVAELEFKFIKPMCEMELNGIHIDIEKLRVIMSNMEKEKVIANKTITSTLSSVETQTTLFGVTLINIDSNKQLKEALNKYGLQLDSTAVDALEKYSGIEIIDAILNYRKVQKLISTYGENLIAKLHPLTERLHTHFRQMVSTGRLSSSNPNLQNMPHDQLFRSCFVAREGYSLITSDMSSAELVILGNLSKDKIFIDSFAAGLDLHTVAASLVFNVPYEQVTKQQRTAAKAVQFGLCLSEDTDIITNYGVKKIQNVEVGEITPHDEGTNEVIGKAYMGDKEVFEIETQYGYTLEATSDHLVKVINSDGEYVDKKLKFVDIDNDYICLRSNINFFPSNDFIFNTFSVEKKTNYKHFNLPKKMDNRIAEFLGLFVSEGSVISVRNRNKYSSLQFSFSDKEPGFIKKIDELLNYLFNGRLTRLHKDDAIRYKFHSVLFCEWLAHICNIKKNINKTNNICIPECVKQSSKKIQTSFLQWLFEGDGSVKQNGKGYAITYSSKSFKLVKDIQLMLLNFGILSSIRGETRKKYPGEIYYEIRLVSDKSRLNFVNNIGFVTKHKNNKCIDNCNSRKSVYFLPNQINKLDNILALINKQKCKTNELYDIIYNAKNRKTGIGSIHFKKLSKYDSLVKFIYENDIIPLPIKAIKSKGIKKVYDLSIKDHPYFLANGFVVHNCYGLSKYGLAKRLKISDKQADKMIKGYFKNYSGIKKFLDKAGKDGVKYRYSTSISGRKRYYTLPHYEHKDFKTIKRSIERQAKNMTIQACLCFNSKIKGIGNIGDQVDKIITLETGLGKDKALGVYSGKKDVYNLKLSNGVDMEITLNHKIPILNKKVDVEALKDVAVEDLCKDDLIMIPLNVIEGETTDISGYKYKKGHWRETFVDYKLPNKMDKKLAFIIGCLIGDGSYTMHNHFRFVCPTSQKELFEKFNNYVIDTFGYTPVIKYVHKSKNGIQYTPLPYSQVSSVVIRGFLKHIGLDYVIHHNKKVPNYFYTETIENKGALLNGLFSTDGSFRDKSGPNYTTVSKELAIGIQQLLFTLGINSALKIYKGPNRLVYRINIFKRFNCIFKKLIGFSVNDKQNKLNQNCVSITYRDKSLVPSFIPKTIEKVLRRSPTYFKDFNANDKAHLRRFKLGECSYSSWRKFYNKLPECKEKLMLFKYLNFDFCRKESLEYIGKEDTYDLMCDNIHYFTANGIIVHNSNADTVKEAMVLLCERLEPYDAKLILTVHDEVVVEVIDDQKIEVAEIVSQSMVDGFAKYFSTIPMESDSIIGPCWIKDVCKCGCNEMKFINDDIYHRRLVCTKCGANQQGE